MRVAGVALLSVLAGAVIVAGQEPFRASIDLVALNVVVTDANQKPVTGLKHEQFRVFEDGVQQDVSFFAASDVPLDLALLLDTSASMADKMKTVQQAATEFLATLNPDDRVSIVDIKDSAKVLHPLNGSFDAARLAVQETRARGRTALYNGLYVTLKEMVKRRPVDGEVRRQAITVLSDGDDTASLVSFDDVLDIARRSGVALYAIALRSPGDARPARQPGPFSTADYSMKALALETGARAFFASDIAELDGIYRTISEELAHQYSLGYTSKNPKRDGAFRRIIVQVTNQTGVRTRTRSGYMSAAPGHIALR